MVHIIFILVACIQITNLKGDSDVCSQQGKVSFHLTIDDRYILLVGHNCTMQISVGELHTMKFCTETATKYEVEIHRNGELSASSTARCVLTRFMVYLRHTAYLFSYKDECHRKMVYNCSFHAIDPDCVKCDHVMVSLMVSHIKQRHATKKGFRPKIKIGIIPMLLPVVVIFPIGILGLICYLRKHFRQKRSAKGEIQQGDSMLSESSSTVDDSDSDDMESTMTNQESSVKESRWKVPFVPKLGSQLSLAKLGGRLNLARLGKRLSQTSLGSRFSAASQATRSVTSRGKPSRRETRGAHSVTWSGGTPSVVSASTSVKGLDR